MRRYRGISKRFILDNRRRSLMSAPGYPVEVNTSNLATGRTDMKISDEMVALADRIVVNTDAHSLSDMTTRPMGLDYLRAGGYPVLCFSAYPFRTSVTTDSMNGVLASV